MEPRAPTPEKRLEAIAALNEAGVPAGVMAAPIIPAINDSEIEAILTRAYAAGAREAGYVVLRLPLEFRDMFREWLQVHFPDRLKHARVADPVDARGQGLRGPMGPAHGGLRPLRLDDRPTLRDGQPPPRLPREPIALRIDLFRKPAPAAKEAGVQLSLF